MFSSKIQVLVALVAAAVAVHAQAVTDPSASGSATDSASAVNPTSTAGISPCIIGCVAPAAQANGCAFTDPKCVCASAQFQADARTCLEDKCTAEEVSAAEALQASQCGAISVTPTGSATTPAASGSGNSSITIPLSTGNVTNTSTKPTGTAPGSSGTPSGTTNGTAPPASTSSAAASINGVGMGVLAAVAGLVGLVL